MHKPSMVLADSTTQSLRSTKPKIRQVAERSVFTRGRYAGILAGSLVILVSGMKADAATVTWDSDGAGPLTGGTGIWDTTTPLWDTGGGTYVTWSNAAPDSAVFGPAAGTVSLGEAITAAAVSLNTNNYIVDLNGFDLTVQGATGGSAPQMNTVTIRNTSATAATFSTAGFGGNSGPRLTGNLNVIYQGGAWNPSISTHDFTGTLSLLGSGTVRSDGVPIGSDIGLLRLGGTHTLQLGTAAGQFRTYNRDIELLGNAASINPGGLRTLTLAGDISGAGEFRQGSTQGAIVLTGDNSYAGPTYLVGAGVSLIAASDTAFGNSTLVETRGGAGGNVTASTIGFQGNVNIGSTARIVLPGGNPASGLGALQNFSDDNRFAGNIELGSNTPRVFGVNEDSSLTLTGAISQARGFTKVGEGTLILTGQNVYGTSSSVGQGWTAVNNGVLRLDFSQTVPGHDSDILNFGISSNTAATYLSLGGGTLEIKGREGATNSQRFKNNATAGLGFTINPGASSIVAIQNGATSLTANLGQINTRSVGGTVDLVLPEVGAFTLPTGTLPSAGTNGLIVAHGSAFMTVGRMDWAARDASNNVVPGSSVPGFYTPNDGTTISGNADISSGIDPILATNADVASIRFHDTSARTIVAGANTVTTGGILVTPNVGPNPAVIAGGTLRAAPAAANHDLVIVQGNTEGDLIIASSIADTTALDGVTPAAAALTKSGAGTLILTGANTYTGVTTVGEGALVLQNAAALGSGNLVVNGGVIGLTGESGDFTRALGTGPDTVRFLGSGGFAAYGGDLIVNIGGLGANVSWNGTNFIPTMSDLILSAPDADGTVLFQNGINILPGAASPISRTVRVENGSAPVDAILAGVVAQEGGFIKAGAGALEMRAVNTYSGPTFVNEGNMIVTGALSASSPITVQEAGTLSGNGTVGGITLLDGGTIAPGVITGALNTRSLALNGGTIEVQIAQQFDFDELNVVGTVRFNEAVNLSLALASTFQEGTQFTILNNDLTDAIIFGDAEARFAYAGSPLDEGAIFSASTGLEMQPFQISYIGGDGNDIVLTAIPEPTSALLLIGGIGALLAGRRRRTQT